MGKIKKFIPIILIFLLIIYLTMQSPEETNHLSYELQMFLFKTLPVSSGRWIYDMHWFRSLLHIPLYFTLGVVVSKVIPLFSLDVVICGIIAVADETLKNYLPTREFEGRDIVLDFIGFFIGICLIFSFRWIKRLYFKYRA